MSQIAYHLAPMVIIFGVLGVLVGAFWIVGADVEQSDGDGPMLGGMFFSFTRAILRNPAATLPGLAIAAAGGGLIWLGVLMR